MIEKDRRFHASPFLPTKSFDALLLPNASKVNITELFIELTCHAG
jgi:hypothetical protein